MTDPNGESQQHWSIQLPEAQWTLSTDRLKLRPYEPDDAPCLTELVSRRDIAATTLNIPHPYPDDAAARFINRVREQYSKSEGVNWAICLCESGALIGGIGLGFTAVHRRAELGYWIDPGRWGRGYATEASRAVIRLGFETLCLHRIDAHYMAHNPASGRVLLKAGMKHEGTLRQHVFKWNEPVDIAVCGILRAEYDAALNERNPDT